MRKGKKVSIADTVDARFKITKPITKNFTRGFLRDFGIGDECKEFYKEAKERFHLPITFHELDGHEEYDHYHKKQLVHDYIYETYYLNNGCKYLVTTELQQEHRPFESRIDGEEKVLYKLDICVIKPSQQKIFDIEIDGKEHFTKKGMYKDSLRDQWLASRYNNFKTLRIDKNDEIPYKQIDKFLAQ